MRRSSGSEKRNTMSRAVISIPGVQKPHCSAWWRVNASRSSSITGSASKPSMVRTSHSSACTA
jgi:hypothetical protein